MSHCSQLNGAIGISKQDAEYFVCQSLPERSCCEACGTGKKVYRAITRGLFNFTDREGGGVVS
jgi:hypothetical protein